MSEMVERVFFLLHYDIGTGKLYSREITKEQAASLWQCNASLAGNPQFPPYQIFTEPVCNAVTGTPYPTYPTQDLVDTLPNLS